MCDNVQTCLELVHLPAKSQETCCTIASGFPIPAKIQGRGRMWSWNRTDNACTVYVGDVPRPGATGDCVAGRMGVPVPAPSPPPAPAPAGAKNVLLIVVDDLRTELAGGYDHPDVHTPNLSAFAAQSLVFEAAHCQIAVCGPSRSSFMTGRRPDSTTAYTFGRHFRLPDVGANWTSLPQHFKEHGYVTLGSGKLYHPQLPPLYDAPLSWSPENGELYENDDSWPDNRGATGGTPAIGCAETQPVDMCQPIAWCAVNTSAAERALGDASNVALAAARLRGLLKATPGRAQQPFFLGIGLHKPHLPWSVPQRFFDLYPDAAQVPLAKHKYPPAGMPPVAFNPSSNCTATAPMPDAYAHQARRAYMAAISYMDAFVGEILAALDDSGRANDTLVAFTSDLGEHGEWQKMTNFDLATRVPLMVRAPWKGAAAAGKRSSALVELVDLFPALAELAGLPAAPRDTHPLEGKSFAPALDDPQGWAGKGWALSQYARCPSTADPYSSPCPMTAPTNGDITVMGYSLRVPGWRYTEWASFDGAADGGKGRVDWAAPLHGVELYDHRSGTGDVNDFDAHENANVVNRTENAALVAELSKQLRAVVANSTAHG
eukprot:g2297.t1